MTNCIFSKEESTWQKKLAARARTLEELQQRGVIAGPGSAVREQLQEPEQAGRQRIMLQWLDLNDLDGMEALAKTFL